MELTNKQIQTIIDYIDGNIQMVIDFGHEAPNPANTSIRIQDKAERIEWEGDEYTDTLVIIFDNFEDDAHYVGFRASDGKLDLIEASTSIRSFTLGEPIYYGASKNIINK